MAMPKKVLLLIITITILLTGGYFLLFKDNSQPNLTSLVPFTQKESLAFQELTIPYLKKRDYQSSLGPLQRLAQNTDFTSYLTSYDSDGLKINGLLTIPQGEEPAQGWPAIVFVHGYIPPSTYQTQANYNSYVDYLAKNGFVVFKIDLRGHGDSEGEAGGGYFSGDYVIDTLNARAALAQSDFVNPRKIGLWGHSMSGNIVMRSLAAQPDIPAIVIWAGAVYTYEDMQELGINDNSYRPQEGLERKKKREELRAAHGDFDKESDFWQQVPPTNYLENIQGVIQIHHATNDPVVSIEYSRNLTNILENTDIFHQLFEYPSGGHNLTGTSFTQAMQRTVEFFASQLQ
jgi:dipeptidyl aminopeptidase/acylaminoacyl peptidase